MPASVLTYQKKSSSQSKPLLLMLNGDYAAEILEIPGSGINAGGMEGRCPLVPSDGRAARAFSAASCVTWTGRRPEQHLVWNLFRNWLTVMFIY